MFVIIDFEFCVFVLKADNNTNNNITENNVDPLMDIWCKCGSVQRSIQTNPQKWFKVPDDYLQTWKLKNLNLNKYNKIYLELYREPKF